ESRVAELEGVRQPVRRDGPGLGKPPAQIARIVIHRHQGIEEVTQRASGVGARILLRVSFIHVRFVGDDQGSTTLGIRRGGRLATLRLGRRGGVRLRDGRRDRRGCRGGRGGCGRGGRGGGLRGDGRGGGGSRRRRGRWRGGGRLGGLRRPLRGCDGQTGHPH